MEVQKALQFYTWKFQCIVTCIVYILSLAVVAILINFAQDWKYDEGIIFDNYEINTKICMSMLMGVISLLLSMKPDIIGTIPLKSSEVDPIEMGVKVSSDQEPDDLTDQKPKESKAYSRSFIIQKTAGIFLCIGIFLPLIFGTLIQNNIKPQGVFLRSYYSNTSFGVSLKLI